MIADLIVAVPDIMTLVTKFTMAEAGCSGSSSANTWHWLSVLLPGLRATNPKIRLKPKKKVSSFITLPANSHRRQRATKLLRHLALWRWASKKRFKAPRITSFNPFGDSTLKQHHSLFLSYERQLGHSRWWWSKWKLTDQTLLSLSSQSSDAERKKKLELWGHKMDNTHRSISSNNNKEKGWSDTHLEVTGIPVSSVGLVHRRSSGSSPQKLIVLTG